MRISWHLERKWRRNERNIKLGGLKNRIADILRLSGLDARCGVDGLGLDLAGKLQSIELVQIQAAREVCAVLRLFRRIKMLLIRLLGVQVDKELVGDGLIL